MDKARLIQVHNTTAKDYADAYSNPSARLDEFLKYINPKSKILDLGCGAGNNATHLAALGHQVTGIDLSDEMLRIAKSTKSPAAFIKMDIEEPDFPFNSFDHIVAAYSICYLPKTKVLGCLKSLYGILKENGLLFIKIGEGKSGEITRVTSVGPKLEYDFNVMSQNEIKELLEIAGFSVLEIYSDENTKSAHINLRDLCVISRTNKSH